MACAAARPTALRPHGHIASRRQLRDSATVNSPRRRDLAAAGDRSHGRRGAASHPRRPPARPVRRPARRPRRDPRPLPRLGVGDPVRPLSGPGGGDPRADGRQPRDPQHPHRLGQVAGGAGPPLQGDLRGEALLLHQPDQGAGVGEVLLAVRGLRRRAGRDGDRRRRHQSRRAGGLLHRRGALQHGAAPRRDARRPLRGDGRVPLLLGPRAGGGLAGAADHPAADDVPADVGDPGQHRADRRAAGARHRGRGGDRQLRPPAGAARLRLPRHPAPRDRPGPARLRPGADLHRQLHPARGGGAGAEPDQPEARQPRRARRHPRRHRRLPLRHPLRQGVQALPRLRRRRPPRRAAAQVPAARRAARPAGAAQGDLRHRHPGGGGQHPHPHGAVHQARQVRRHQGRHPLGARLQADRRPRRAQGLRRPRLGGGAGARARHREAPDRPQRAPATS